MSETPISPLRQRMIEDMTVRKLGAATQRNYIRAVKSLSEFLGRSPATATAEDLRRFQVHQSEAGAQPSAMNSTVTALRFFLRVTLDRPEMGRHLTLVRQPRKLPNVLINGFETTQAIYVAVTLGVPDLLRGGPLACDQLASAIGSHPGSLYRLLRALSAIGLLHESRCWPSRLQSSIA